jgi:hypothetical protein
MTALPALPALPTLLPFPEPPSDLPAERRAVGQAAIRFEDITQDGRLVLEGLAPALGEVVWRRLLAKSNVLEAFRANKAVPILTRIVTDAGDGPFSTHHPLEAAGCYELGHVAGANGGVERILLNMWIDATLPIGKNYGPPPERAGERIRAGRFFGEHVLTRLFAPPDQRKVTRLEWNGAELHGPARPWVTAESVGALPAGATALEDIRVDPTPIVFGVAHTDSNQHVNSLVYPRLFEDAAVRRFAELGRIKPPVLSRHMEAAFRKPCFAGEKYAIALRAFLLGGKIGAAGAFVEEKDARDAESFSKARPHCFVRMVFE